MNLGTAAVPYAARMYAFKLDVCALLVHTSWYTGVQGDRAPDGRTVSPWCM